MKRTIPAAVFAVGLVTGGAFIWKAAAAPAETATTASTGVRAADTGKEPVTQPLREEHKELAPHIEAIGTAGDAVAVAPRAELIEKVHASHEFLTAHLIPHAVAEDKVLYVEVDRLIGSNGSTHATDTMRRDHAEVVALTEQLGTLAEKLQQRELMPAEQQDLRQVLYALNGIIDLHFAKEEEVYLPLLDRKLTAEEAQRMFEQMEKISTSSDGGEAGH